MQRHPCRGFLILLSPAPADNSPYLLRTEYRSWASPHFSLCLTSAVAPSFSAKRKTSRYGQDVVRKAERQDSGKKIEL